MSTPIDIKDYQRRLLALVHEHGAAEDWCALNSALEHLVEAAAARNPAVARAYRRDLLGRVTPGDPTATHPGAL